MTKTFIIILNYNGGKDVVRCVKSVMGEGKRLKWRGLNVLVVDNGSKDGSVDEIKKIIKKNQLSQKIKIILNKKNLGFAAGNNVGIKYALRHGAEAVMLLNQDTVVQKNFLQPLSDHPADIVAPVIKFKRGKKWVYDQGGKINWWLGRSSHLEKEAEQDCDEKIDYVSGCAMLVKRTVFDKIGFLSERFFLYFEDADFCLRAQKDGFKVAVEPKSIIIHKLSEKEKKPLKQHFSMLKSNLIFINRHLPFYQRISANIYWLFLVLKVILNELFKRT